MMLQKPTGSGDHRWLLRTVFLLAAEAGEADSSNAVMVVAIALVTLIAFVSVIILMLYGKLWFRAYMSGAHVRMLSLIGMTFRQVNPAGHCRGKNYGRSGGRRERWERCRSRVLAPIYLKHTIWLAEMYRM